MTDTGLAIGIDLGTTNSLIAVFEDAGPRLIPNALGEVLTPSAVGFAENGDLLIGQAAKDRLATHPDLTSARFKRYMGTDRIIQMGKHKFTPVDLSSFILKALKEDAEAALGQPVTQAVISVPAYFNDIQRKATLTAAQLAGLKVSRLVNEPTAAALAYGLHDKDGESTFLIIDLGGGTFDVSILEMFSGVMEVRSSAGDAFLGGEDYTAALAKEFCRQLGVEPDKLSKEDQGRIRRLADKAKVALTQEMSATLKIDFEGKEQDLTINRTGFDEVTADLTKRLRMPVQRAISDAGLTGDQIDRIILVGGATRMPAIRNLVTKLFKRFPEHDLDPDHVVALGAAVQSGLLSRHAALEDVVMTDVSAFTLGFEASHEIAEGRYESGHFSPLIERNTVIPASRSDVVVPTQKGQNKLNVSVYQGEAPFVRDNVKIGELTVAIPANKKDYEQVEIRYTYDTSGILEVEAKALSTGQVTRAVFKGSAGTLSDEDVQRRLAELKHLKIHPRDEAENTALMSRLSAIFQNALGADRDHITRLITHFEGALHTQDKRTIAEAREEIIAIVKRYEDHDVFT